MNRFLIIAIILLSCNNPMPAQVNHYVIDSTFNTGDYYTKGTIHQILYRNDFQDLYVNFNRHHGLGEVHGQSIVDLNGNLLYNVNYHTGGRAYLYRKGILATGYGGVIYRVLPPHPNAGVDSEVFFFEYSKNIYSFPGKHNLNGEILVLPDNTFLMAGRYAADSLNPGIHGYRHLVR